MRRLAALASVLALASSGCPSSARTTPDGGRGDAGSIADAPIPDGLIFKAALRDPDALWARVQRGAGGPLALLPSTLSALATALVGADGSLGVDGHATSFAAVVARRQGGDVGGGDREAGGVGWVIAMPAPGDARAPPARPDASFVWEREPGWLVLASDSQTLASAGAYVARRLPSDTSLVSVASFAAIAPASAVAGPVATRLTAAWAATRAWLLDSARTEREAHGGRAPDFTDPVAIVDTVDAVVNDCVGRLVRAGELRIEGDARDDDLRVYVRATPGAASVDLGDGGLSEDGLGDTRPLAELPSDAPLAVLVRSGLAQRTAFARELSMTVAHLLASDGPRFEAAMGAATLGWAQATGDWMTLSLTGDGGLTGPALWVRTPVASDSSTKASAPRAVRDLFALSKRSPLRTLLEGAFHVGPAVFGPDVGGVSSATFSRVDSAKGPNGPKGDASGSSGAAWSVDGDRLSLVVGPEPFRRMTQAAASASPTQADDPRTARVLSAVGEGVAWALLAQPLRFGRMGAAAPSAPFVVAGGTRAGGLWGRVDVADELFAEGVRLGGGLF
jgi:hypothetical protein